MSTKKELDVNSVYSFSLTSEESRILDQLIEKSKLPKATVLRGLFRLGNGIIERRLGNGVTPEVVFHQILTAGQFEK